MIQQQLRWSLVDTEAKTIIIYEIWKSLSAKERKMSPFYIYRYSWIVYFEIIIN